MLSPGATLPIVIEPGVPRLDPLDWARGQHNFIESALRHHGAILFRNFDLRTPCDFEAFAEAMSPGLYGGYGDLPKKEEGNNIYRSTPYPEQKMILFHNESSHLARWPGKQWFFCELPAPNGGATPLVDVREMVRRLPPEVAARFEQKSLLYIRTFIEGLDVPWRDFFKTADRGEVEAQCRATGTEFTWLDDEVLQTRTLCRAIIRHPVTGERAFFNQVQLHHPSSLDPQTRDDLIDLLGADRLPRNVLYGDGTPIEDEVMALIGKLYEAIAVRFRWQQGDVIMLDNMLTAHARDPYEGPRKIVVAMGEMMSRQELAS
jgi:alpha-ketoglutarate-dependent taurine dioxygenase